MSSASSWRTGGLSAASVRVFSPGPHDALVPVFLDAELIQGDLVDFLLDLAFGPAGPDQVAPFDLVKQRLRTFLSLDQRHAPLRRRCLSLLHTLSFFLSSRFSREHAFAARRAFRPEALSRSILRCTRCRSARIRPKPDRA